MTDEQRKALVTALDRLMRSSQELQGRLGTVRASSAMREEVKPKEVARVVRLAQERMQHAIQENTWAISVLQHMLEGPVENS